MKITPNLKHEPSTYRGAVMFLGTLLGVIYPDLLDRCIASAARVSGLIRMFFPDRATEDS